MSEQESAKGFSGKVSPVLSYTLLLGHVQD